jgi:hypothetical protein
MSADTKPAPARDPRFGSVARTCREGDRIHLERDGERLGYLEVVRVPHDAKIRLCLCLDRDIRIVRDAP